MTHGYRIPRQSGPLVDPMNDRATRAVIFTANGSAHVDNDEDEPIRVAGFTRAIDFASVPYVGRHRREPTA